MLTPAVSFVIPVLNEAGTIGPLLRLLAARYPASQCLVVDGGSSDDTVAQATPLCAGVLRSEAGRALQMNAGAEAATGRYIFFLHADTLPDISERDLQHSLESGPRWGFFTVRLSGSHWFLRIIERAMNLRSTFTHVATGDQMIFVQRDTFENAGGFALIPLMEDIEFSKRMRRQARPLVIRQAVETSSRRWEEGGIFTTVVRMWILRLGYFLGVSPARLKAHYADG